MPNRTRQNDSVTLFEDLDPATVVFTDGACVGNPGPGGPRQSPREGSPLAFPGLSVMP